LLWLMLYHSFRGVPPVWYAAIPIYESKFDTSGEERLNYFIINMNKYLWGLQLFALRVSQACLHRTHPLWK
jgi:hypothetical protein